MTLILVSLLYVRRIQITFYVHDVCCIYLRQRDYGSLFEVFTFDAYMYNVEVLRIL